MKVAVLYGPSLPMHGWCVGDKDAVPPADYEKRILDWGGSSAHPVQDIYLFELRTWAVNTDRADVEAKLAMLGEQDAEINLRVKRAKALELGYADLVEQYDKELSNGTDKQRRVPETPR